MHARPLALPALAAIALGCHAASASPPPPVQHPSPSVPEAAPVVKSGADDFRFEQRLAAPAKLEIVTPNGSIEAEPSDGDRVEVRARVRGHGDPSKVRIVARPHAGGVVVCALFHDAPADECVPGYEPHGRDHHPDDDDDDDLRVDFSALVPSGVALGARSMNGAIAARDLRGRVDASTMNGDVRIVTSTVAQASTLNGAVDVTLGAVPDAPLAFETKNGKVSLRLPAGVDADLEASTMNGQIRANFPIDVDSVPMGIGPKEGHARLGKGGPKIEAHTLNGDVVLRSGG